MMPRRKAEKTNVLNITCDWYSVPVIIHHIGNSEKLKHDRNEIYFPRIIYIGKTELLWWTENDSLPTDEREVTWQKLYRPDNFF